MKDLKPDVNRKYANFLIGLQWNVVVKTSYEEELEMLMYSAIY